MFGDRKGEAKGMRFETDSCILVPLFSFCPGWKEIWWLLTSTWWVSSPPASFHLPVGIILPRAIAGKPWLSIPKLAEKQSGYPDGIISAGVSCSDNAGTTHHPPKRCSQQLFSPRC